MAKNKGFWTKQRKGMGREIYLYTALVGFAIMALVKGGWIIAISFISVIGVGLVIAFILRSRHGDL